MSSTRPPSIEDVVELMLEKHKESDPRRFFMRPKPSVRISKWTGKFHLVPQLELAFQRVSLDTQLLLFHVHSIEFSIDNCGNQLLDIDDSLRIVGVLTFANDSVVYSMRDNLLLCGLVTLRAELSAVSAALTSSLNDRIRVDPLAVDSVIDLVRAVHPWTEQVAVIPLCVYDIEPLPDAIPELEPPDAIPINSTAVSLTSTISTSSVSPRQSAQRRQSAEPYIDSSGPPPTKRLKLSTPSRVDNLLALLHFQLCQLSDMKLTFDHHHGFTIRRFEAASGAIGECKSSMHGDCFTLLPLFNRCRISSLFSQVLGFQDHRARQYAHRDFRSNRNLFTQVPKSTDHSKCKTRCHLLSKPFDEIRKAIRSQSDHFCLGFEYQGSVSTISL